MYKVILINNSVETIIHYPNADKESPHLIGSLPLKESLSSAEQLSFYIPINNPGYDIITSLTTKVKVIDTRDNAVKFIGRVMNVSVSMGSGEFVKTVSCEGALAYLMDTTTRRWKYIDKSPTYILTDLLTKHNTKVDSSRQILLGTIEITQLITIDTNYETTLNAVITKLHNILGGDLRVREANNILYLDYLTDQGTDNNVEIRLGYNMKDIMLEYDPCDLVTRIVPLGYGEGINQLDITSVNSGIDYIEDAIAIGLYGRVEAPANNTEIQNANTLKIWAQTLLSEKKQPRLTLGISMMDLSVLIGHEGEKFVLGDSLHTYNSVMGIDNLIARVIECQTDLMQPWNPQLVISTKPLKISDQIIDLKQRNMSLENAPQGSTFITTYNANDNLDETHNIKIPIWLSPDIIYVNRVALHIESQKFRAYEKGMAAGGSSTATSSSGGSSTATSSSGGSSSPTSSSNGESTQTSSANGEHRHLVAANTQVDTITTVNRDFRCGANLDGSATALFKIAVHDSESSTEIYTYGGGGSHTHDVTTPAHTHSVSVPAHTHSVDIPAHTHTVEIPSHIHEIEYGIFEDTYTAGSKILINGVEVADGPNNGGSLDIDISYWVGTPGTAYTLEITSTQRGRVSVQVNVQAFIQSK